MSDPHVDSRPSASPAGSDGTASTHSQICLASTGEDRSLQEGSGSAPDRVQLFRHEVLAERQNQWVGSVVLAPRASHRLFTMVAAVACAGLVALLLLGHFTRTARLGGWLVPQEGVARVFAPRPGVVTAMHVREGAQVHKGDPLLNLSDELRSASLGATQALVMRRLQERRDSLADEQLQQRQLLAQQQTGLAGRIAALDSEHAQIESEMRLLKERALIAMRSEDLHRLQFDQGFISEQRLQLVRAERLEQQSRIAALERSRLANRRDRLAAQAELRDLPLRAQRELGLLDRSISQLDQERAETEARREIVVTAPQDGNVTSIQAVAGTNADTAVPMLSIVPLHRHLEAHLYGPSRAIGFVRAGQRVLLRYQAYPYQKFGHHEGMVRSVSQSAVGPGELPRELAGLGALAGSPGGLVTEPIYRITVSLDTPALESGGASLPLQPGMQLEADVSLERRRLVEWLLEPVFRITGRWQQ